MGNLSDWFGQVLSRRASKAAVDAVSTQKDGASAYRTGGKILLGCGIAWLLLSLIPIVCKNPLGEWGWMLILAAVQIGVGTSLVVLSKKSKRFQAWAEKDFRKSLKEREDLAKKVQIGKRTLPISRGDLLALKALGIIAVILLAVLGIGYLQGWVV